MGQVYDVLILGHGIAGAVLAETCLRHGLKVHVLDRRREGNASLAAAGIVNPVVLRRDVPSWRAAELMPLAAAFYADLQRRLGVECWHSMPLVKVFPTPHEVAQWERAVADPATAPFIGRCPEPEVDAAPLHAPFGYGTVTAAAWLDVPRLLSAQRMELLWNCRVTEVEVAESDVQPGRNGIRIGGVEGRWLVRCEGPFAQLPGLLPVKGETLTVRIPGLHLSRMVHRGLFLIPLGGECFRVGATFNWENVWDGPTPAARTWLMERLATLVDAPVEVLDQHSGVRPTSKDRRPIIGVIAEQEAVLNGLGSRGVLLAPWCAEQLLAHLFNGRPLDAEIRCGRFNR
jgi:glycine/D-amino acid oxidase-like deaminating enzyme